MSISGKESRDMSKNR